MQYYSKTEKVTLALFLGIGALVETLLSNEVATPPRGFLIAAYAVHLSLFLILAIQMWTGGIERHKPTSTDRRMILRAGTVVASALFTVGIGTTGLVGPHLLDRSLTQIRWTLLSDFLGY